MKTCYKCKISKNESEFYKDKSRKDGLRYGCKECGRKYEQSPKGRAAAKRGSEKYEQKPKRKAGKKRNAKEHELTSKCKEYRRKYYLKHTYGITLADYDEMLEQQRGGCAICGGVSSDGSRLAVDHDHETGEVRGLLCMNCNLKLGWYDKNKQNVDVYLEGK